MEGCQGEGRMEGRGAMEVTGAKERVWCHGRVGGCRRRGRRKVKGRV